MDIAIHITFYYIENRIEYIKRILQNLSAIPHNIKVFIYSNRRFNLISNYRNIDIELIPFIFLDNRRRLKFLYRFIPLFFRQHIDPYYLAWKNRIYVKGLIDRYDVQIYMEDDIGFTNDSFKYWMEYKEICKKNNFNLGFLRFEVDVNNNRLLCTDLCRAPRKTVNIDDQLFLLNDVNVYCGFWIYDREELKKFVETREWDFKFNRYDVREKAAIGWHGVDMTRYKGTVIPLKITANNTYVIHDGCKVHHFPNNYVGHRYYCSVEFPIKLVAAAEDMM